MILDNETQRQLILNALLNVKIEGDFGGISEMLPQMAKVIDDVKEAKMGDK